MTQKKKSVLIEREEYEGAYGHRGRRIIIDHPTHGRLLLWDDYGGDTQLRGGAIRWKHGGVAQLLPGDTFQSLQTMEDGCFYTPLEAIQTGRDEYRRILDWPGTVVEKVANSVLD